MKQLRKLSNLIADELIEAGMSESDSAFEGRVSEIVNMISEAVSEKKTCEEDEDEVVLEDVDVEDIYMASSETTLGGKKVAAGEFVEVVEVDMDDGKAIINIYDEEGEVKFEDVEADLDSVSDFADSAEVIDLDEGVEDDEEVEEALHIKGGAKVKISAAKEKLKAKLAAKKGDGVNKFTIKNGKIVKKSAEQIKADKKKAKTFAKRMKKFKAKRAKSLKKAAKIKESFDLTSDSLVFALEAGDILTVEEGAASVTRNGSVLVSGLKISENFLERCIAEGVIDEESVTETSKTEVEEAKTHEGDEDVCPECGKNPCECGETKTDEAAMLTFKSGKGYVLVREGSELVMGNRIRARATLSESGFNVTAEQLDKAVDGELVIL